MDNKKQNTKENNTEEQDMQQESEEEQNAQQNIEEQIPEVIELGSEGPTPDNLLDLPPEMVFGRSSIIARSPPVKRQPSNKVQTTLCLQKIQTEEKTTRQDEKGHGKNKTNTTFAVTLDKKRKRKINKRNKARITDDETSDSSWCTDEEEFRKSNKKADRRTTPPNKKALIRERKARHEMVNYSKEDLEMAIQKSAEDIEEVVNISSNLKGVCAKDIKEATARIKAACFYLCTKDNDAGNLDDSGSKKETRNLEDRIEKLENEKKEIIRELTVLKEQIIDKDKKIKELNKKVNEKETELKKQIADRDNKIEELNRRSNENEKEVGKERGESEKQRDERSKKEVIQEIREEIRKIVPELTKEIIMNIMKEKTKTNRSLVSSPNKETPRTYAEVTRDREREIDIEIEMEDIADRTEENREEDWTEVNRRETNKRSRNNDNEQKRNAQDRKDRGRKIPGNSNVNTPKERRKKETEKRETETRREATRKRLPFYHKTTAVTIASNNPEISHEEIMITARNRVNPTELGIDNIKMKKSISGNIVLQINGEENIDKAKKFANKLQMALSDKEVSVRCPTKMKEIIIRELDEGTNQSEIKNVQSGAIKAWRSGTLTTFPAVPFHDAFSYRNINF